MKPKISIVVCTKDRADSLGLTLESINQTTVTADFPVELLVVDNGSKDHTERVVQTAGFVRMPVRYIREPRVGKSYAYNTAISAAAGEVLLCTDDDVRVPDGWIEGMCRSILEGKADAVAGGVVFPAHIETLFQEQPLKNRRGWFASTHELDARYPGRMVGANMAFHRRVLEKVPEFDTELGPGPLGLGNFEDTMFSWQLVASGYRLTGAVEVAVEHHFDLTRIAPEALVDAARKIGRSHGFVFHHWEHRKSRLVVPRLWLSRLRRYWLQAIHGAGGTNVRQVSDEALILEKDQAFYREYIAQRRRGFKYPLRRPAKIKA